MPASPGDWGICEEPLVGFEEEELPEGALCPPAPGPLKASLSSPSSRLFFVPGAAPLEELPEEAEPAEEEALLPEPPVVVRMLTSVAAMFPPPV